MTEAVRRELADRETVVEGWIEALVERRTALAERHEAFADPEELLGVPDGLARELRGLIVSLVEDLDAQVEDLQGDLETLRKLRSMLADAGDETRAELVEYAEDLDDALAQKGQSIADLVETADQLVERFDRIIESPTEDDPDPGPDTGVD